MFSLRKFGLIVAAIALASLAGCGQYGPLYLPSKPLPRGTAQGGAQSGAQGAEQRASQDASRNATTDDAQDDAQDSDFNAQPPALDKSRQP